MPSSRLAEWGGGVYGFPVASCTRQHTPACFVLIVKTCELVRRRSLSPRTRPLASPRAVNFDEAPELQQLVREVNSGNQRAAREADVQRRLDVNDKLLREMYAMLVANAASRDVARCSFGDELFGG